ncbi:MAG: TolC family protein [Sphingobacteriia bacterium]|nr:TolC family protein [Sphingobacteriia bacterium]
MRFIILFFLLVAKMGLSQTYTLEKIRELALSNYPLIHQNNLLKRSESLNIANIKTSLLPQITINGQATYQSDVTGLTIPNNLFKIDALSKDQYKATAEIQQTLYDGGMNKKTRELSQLSLEIDLLKNEVELYKLKERVTQLYCSVLYTDALLQQVNFITTDLNNGLQKVEALYKNGVAFKSNVLQVKAQILKNNQKTEEILAAKKTLYEALEMLSGEKMSDSVVFVLPDQLNLPNEGSQVMRPEVFLFDAQISSIDRQTGLINARTKPRMGTFLQGGYGKPGLNMLKNEFAWFSLAGIRLQWSLGGFYTAKKEQIILQNQTGLIKNQKDTYLLNTNIQLKQQLNEISKLENLISSDKEIIAIREQIKNTALVQLTNGVISANDYLKEVNEFDQSGQTLIQHQIQLVQSKLVYQLLKGKI